MWVDEYVKLMFLRNVNDMRMEEAMLLKYQHTPESLFKYRSFSEYSVSNFLNDEIWFNAASRLNDPFDCALTINLNNHTKNILKSTVIKTLPDLVNKHNIKIENDEMPRLEEMSAGEVLKYVLSLDEDLKSGNFNIDEIAQGIEKAIEQLNDQQLQVMNKRSQDGLFISCFSEVNNSILMWSHYASNHTGFCVEYNFKKPGREPVLTRSLQPVIYTDKLFDMTDYLLKSLEDKDSFNNLISTYAAITKSREWAYEREWRIAFPIGEGSGFNRMIFQPEAVYLGTRMKEEHKKEIIEIAKNKGISVFQMQISNSEFKLVPEKVL